MSRLTRRDYGGGGHSYTIDGEPAIGVTTAINKGVPKPALVNWAATLVAEAAVDQRDEWESKTPFQAVEWLRRRPNERRDSLSVRGVQIHSHAQRLMAGEDVDVPEEHIGHVDACIAFLEDFQVEYQYSEVNVFHVGVRKQAPAIYYAGTADLIALIDNVTWLLDFKTGKGVYGDTALQLAAYRYADFMVYNGNDVPMADIERTGVVHLRADGYDLYPIEAGEAQWRSFLHAVYVAQFCDGSGALVGSPLRPERAAS